VPVGAVDIAASEDVTVVIPVSEDVALELFNRSASWRVAI